MASQPTTLTFTLPTTNTDGSAISSGELVDVDVGYGQTSNGGNGAFAYPTVVEKALTAVDPTNAGSFSVAWSSLSQPVLAPGEWFFSARMKTNLGQLSVWSAEANFTVPAPVPNPPTFGVS